MKNRFLITGLIALVVGACGDDVQIVEPTPPPTPPVTATLAPASATVAVGNSVVFAVNASGGAAGAAATWTCASSNTGIATASTTSVGCQATGVAAGGVTITAVVTKGSETVNVGARLTVTSEEEQAGDPAFILISSIDDGDEDDGVLTGSVAVVVGVERGEQTLEMLSLLVDGAVVAQQSFGGGMGMAPPEDEAAEQAVHSFTLSFNSSGYGDDGTPDYMNAEHTISAELQIAGGTISSNGVPVEFSNPDGVHVAVSGLGAGAMNSTTGQIWYGGPLAMIEITAVPVLYSGGSATAVGIRTFCGADAATDDEAPFVFALSCKGTSEDGGVTPKFTIAGADIGPVNDIDALYLDFEGPSAPTFSPNPNGREDGWVNLAVDFGGEQKSSNKDGWLTYNDDDAGVGGYIPQLRYAEVPSSGDGLDEALVAPILTLANLPGESDADEYCAVASAVDLLGNESGLPDEEDDGGTCVPAGLASVEEDLNANPPINAEAASDYHLLLETAMADDATDKQKEALANAGLLVGVDITAPAVEFTGASAKDENTDLGAGWTLHVLDGGSGLHTDTINASVEVRNGDGTDELEEGTADNTFAVSTGAGTRFTTVVNGADDDRDAGYYTFAATASDKAGNESASVSRIALHDVDRPAPVRLFAVPGADDFTHDKTLLATDNLSIASYYVTVPVTVAGLTSPEIRLGSTTVDAYDASALTDDIIVRDAVVLPFAAVQDGTQVTAIADIKAYVSDQVGTAAGVEAAIDAPAAADIPQVNVLRIGGSFTVTATNEDDVATVAKGDATVKLTATAELPDASTDFPFSRVDFYAEATVTVDGVAYSELRLIATVDGNSATVKTAVTNGRDWTYAAEVDADAYYAAVDGDGMYTGNVAAFGVSTAKGGSVAVVAVSATLTLEERE